MPGLGPFFALCAAGLGGVYRLEFRPWGLSLGLKVPGVQGLELELMGSGYMGLCFVWDSGYRG